MEIFLNGSIKIFRAMVILIVAALFGIQNMYGQENEQWITFEPSAGQSNGQHIVLVSGDDEYRSEEALPMLAKILSDHQRFKTTVLFAIEPESGEIKPDYQNNIPGLENLESADLMVIFTRFRELPDEQMKYIDEYLQSGKPIIGLRTATHAFAYSEDSESEYAKYSYNSDIPGWEGGFGRQILGETWIDHHGEHGSEGTRGLIDGIKERNDHPVIRGVSDIWGPTDVYGTRELEGDVEVLVWGQSTNGMTPEAPLNWKKSIMPVAWTKTYTSEQGNTGKVFTTTMGSSQDLESEGFRRLLVNACYWALEMEEEIPEKANVDIIGEYTPTKFGFGEFIKGLKPIDYK
ncbi:ThuA domain-containing protein [Aliifodinibius salicampi]|uniref:ThuA domain-containing protein n=1 Tax=Fodinibius salicampi TaxID=1920655 RepID=A0ABT3PXZ0_9BACT|nr:ThuA domain-containing protein [Fodinibius salicampi]MCW9712735.1 ThuA domain-containing protein [Fodinibius salicampi]